jgi:DNA adenine methylase
MRPEKLAQEVSRAASILAGRTEVVAGDYEQLLLRASPHDLVYMDPPYQGTSEGKDRRYRHQLDRARFVKALATLNARNVPYIVSFDGRCGDRTYGEPLPSDLGLHHLEVHAGVSSQATLNGRTETTVESLYLSPNLKGRERGQLTLSASTAPSQMPRARDHAEMLHQS